MRTDTDLTTGSLAAALGWPGGISEPILDLPTLLRMVAELRIAAVGIRSRDTKPDRIESLREMRAELDTHAALIAEVFTIAQLGVLPDGDIVDTPTMLWAEEWARRLAEKEQPK